MASTVRLIALKRIPYGKRSIKLDETFEASERDGDLLVRAGIAKKVAETPHPEQPIAKPPPARLEPPKPTQPIAEVPPPTVTPLQATTESSEPTAEAKPMTTRSRGTYKRRDLTAEGDE